MDKNRTKTAPQSLPTAVDPNLQQLFNQSLREQLQACRHKTTDTERKKSLKGSLKNLTETLLHEPETPHAELTSLFADVSESLISSYKLASLTEAEANSSYINASGVVMAVKDAIHTIKDIYRVKAFIRGIHQALNSQLPKRSLHLVYPACGPFAPLLLPLISYYQQRGTGPEKMKITLIDVQPGAVKVLRQLVDDLDITDYIADIRCQDVLEYQPQQPIDILVMEALQHGLTKEGHLNFARYLNPFLAPNAIMIPEEISVKAFLNVAQREYVDQWEDRDRTHSELVNPDIQNERLGLGEILRVTRKTLSELKTMPLGNSIEMLECGEVRVPTDINNIEKQALLISVSATTFGEEKIQEYDSGITHPLPDMSVCIGFRPPAQQPDDLMVKPGDTLKFYYQLTGIPRFLPTVA
ncbi:MAG: hypothetical protein HLX50_01530 [Alteromonadaceae bacterium]|nr:hypothetical protein [Alteromonadaceae bacterium]